MTLRQISIGLVAAILCVLIPLGGMAKNQRSRKLHSEPPDTKDGLQLSIRLGQESYRLNDIPTLKITLKNVSQSPITIYKKFAWGRSSSFTLGVSTVRGKLVERTFLDDASHWPPFPKEDFITIQPGDSIEQETFLGLRKEGIREPGVYKVTVWYHSPVPQKFAPEGLNIWPTENGVLQSKPVTFRVTL